jgi:hypothetical protein
MGVFAALALLVIIHHVVWALVEAIHPLRYRGIPFAELHDHIREEYRRGLNSSCMILTDEATGRELRICKIYERGDPHVQIRLIAPVPLAMRAEAKEVVRVLAEAGIRCVLGTAQSGWRDGEMTLTCYAGDSLKNTLAAAEHVLLHICSLSKDSTYSVSVRGRIAGSNVHVSGATTVRDHWAVVSPAAVKPYKQWHRSRWAFNLGFAAGRLTRRINSVFSGDHNLWE